MMIPYIERLAVNSWRTAAITGAWEGVSWQFFGLHRFALMAIDSEAAETADFLAELALTIKEDRHVSE